MNINTIKRAVFYGTAFALAASQGFADGPAPGTYDPPVIAPAPTWVGVYAYGQIGQTTYQVVTEEYTEYERECVPTDGHSGHKCSIAGHQDSSEIAALPYEAQPWKTHPYADDSNDGTFQYHPDIVWVDDVKFSYTTRVEGPPDLIKGKNAINQLVRESLVTITEEESERAIGAGVGYRQQYGSIVVGGELSYLRVQDTDTDITLADGHIGYDVRGFLPYVSAGMMNDGDSEFAYGLGVDMRLADGVFAGVKGARSEELARDALTLRVGFNF